MNSLFQTLTIPDEWQQEAVHCLRAGKDAVVHAPTGAGKTYVFELMYPQLRGQAVFTVPTRALANDKLAEWQKRGWDVGIATGDLAQNLNARVLVATLETQKGRLLERSGPALLVIDEYQMIGDPVRGVNYELAIALAPENTQLLLLSGSVANPGDVVDWLHRIGRRAELISHLHRPVPLHEIHLETLADRGAGVRGWWPRVIGNALRADLGPVLLFAPRRNSAEELATQLASSLPPDRPLSLSREQELLAGSRLAKLLRKRVAFHHSGLSYAQRAGLIEPLAKSGDLRVVVATMGLAAGINFSMRSVAVTGTSYKAGQFERQVQPDELLQMYGRAGRRGLDEAGFALVSSQPPRLHDARPRHLRRSTQVDWPSLLAVMHAAVKRGETPYAAAAQINERLFTLQKVPIGVEHSMSTGPMPCGLSVDMERARFARRKWVEILNSKREWETPAGPVESVPLGRALVWQPAQVECADARGVWRPALSQASRVTGVGLGAVCRLAHGKTKIYGRELVIGQRREGRLSLSPSLRKVLHKGSAELPELGALVLARIPELFPGGRILEVFPRGDQLVAHITFEDQKIDAIIDSTGAALIAPPERVSVPLPCRIGAEGRPCPQITWCESVPIGSSPAHAWRQLKLIEPDGVPTRRGIIFSYFQHGEGLAVAAALEDDAYEIEEITFDLANLRAGPRFAGDDSQFSGRLAVACHRAYGRAELEGYLTMGVPVEYGAGAGDAVREIVQHGIPKQKLINEALRLGDVERALLEWRSLLRHVVHAPDWEWDRWRALKDSARDWLLRAEAK